jgi:putative transcriptional regulator
MNVNKPGKGKILISAPFLTDVFNRSVVYLTEHNSEGSIGFILNKPLKLKMNQVLDDFPQFDSKIYYGGPVQQDMLNFFHKCGDVLDGGFHLADGIYWGGNYETLKLLVKNNSVNPDDFKFFLGYAGWAPKQLDGEMETNSWFISKPQIDDLFTKEPEILWTKILKRMGGEYSIISTFPENPSVN